MIQEKNQEVLLDELEDIQLKISVREIGLLELIILKSII